MAEPIRQRWGRGDYLLVGKFKGELKAAFLETGLLAAGGIAGGALSYWLFSDNWLVNAIGAVIGASILYHGARHATARRNARR